MNPDPATERKHPQPMTNRLVTATTRPRRITAVYWDETEEALAAVCQLADVELYTESFGEADDRGHDLGRVYRTGKGLWFCLRAAIAAPDKVRLSLILGYGRAYADPGAWITTDSTGELCQIPATEFAGLYRLDTAPTTWAEPDTPGETPAGPLPRHPDALTPQEMLDATGRALGHRAEVKVEAEADAAAFDDAIAAIAERYRNTRTDDAAQRDEFDVTVYNADATADTYTGTADEFRAMLEAIGDQLEARGEPLPWPSDDPLPWSSDDPGRLDATDGVLADIGNERARQYGELGHSIEDDDTRSQGQLAQLAANWATPTHRIPAGPERRRDLVKAAALLVAEIERLDRITAP